MFELNGKQLQAATLYGAVAMAILMGWSGSITKGGKVVARIKHGQVVAYDNLAAVKTR